jgi:hypothetical protein
MSKRIRNIGHIRILSLRQSVLQPSTVPVQNLSQNVPVGNAVVLGLNTASLAVSIWSQKIRWVFSKRILG